MESLSTEDVEFDQYTLTRMENLSTEEVESDQYTLESLSTEELENDQYTLTRVEELEVAAAILVVFLVIPYYNKKYL